jgi:hypothetical protein
MDTLTTHRSMGSACKPDDVHNLLDRISNCFDDVSAWTMANYLQLDPSKTEVLWCASARHLHQLSTTSMKPGNEFVSPVPTVRHLGFHLNSDVTLTTDVASTVGACFSVLRQIRSEQRSSARDALIALLRAQ